METYAGKVCSKHPELNGLRRKHSRECTQCAKDKNKEYRRNSPVYAEWRKEWDNEPDRKAKKAAAASIRNQRPDLKVRRNIAFMERKRFINEKATPKWADLSRIAEVYETMRKMNEVGGGKYEVDHIYPLRGKLVSGLHVHNNLQILTAAENLSKGNKHDV